MWVNCGDDLTVITYFYITKKTIICSVLAYKTKAAHEMWCLVNPARYEQSPAYVAYWLKKLSAPDLDFNV